MLCPVDMNLGGSEETVVSVGTSLLAPESLLVLERRRPVFEDPDPARLAFGRRGNGRCGKVNGVIWRSRGVRSWADLGTRLFGEEGLEVVGMEGLATRNSRTGVGVEGPGASSSSSQAKLLTMAS